MPETTILTQKNNFSSGSRPQQAGPAVRPGSPIPMVKVKMTGNGSELQNAHELYPTPAVPGQSYQRPTTYRSPAGPAGAQPPPVRQGHNGGALATVIVQMNGGRPMRVGGIATAAPQRPWSAATAAQQQPQAQPRPSTGYVQARPVALAVPSHVATPYQHQAFSGQTSGAIAAAAAMAPELPNLHPDQLLLCRHLVEMFLQTEGISPENMELADSTILAIDEVLHAQAAAEEAARQPPPPPAPVQTQRVYTPQPRQVNANQQRFSATATRRVPRPVAPAPAPAPQAPEPEVIDIVEATPDTTPTA